MPFVIAIEAFHDSQALFFTDAILLHYLYGLRSSVRRGESGELIIDDVKIDEHRYRGKAIPSNFFSQPGTEHLSAVLFTNSGTYPKFGRMGYQAGYHRGNIKIFRRGTCFNPDPNSATPDQFAYDLDFPPCEESWGQGLVVFHNPNAVRPLPRHFFKNAAAHFIEDGRLCPDVPQSALIPFASITITAFAEDDLDLDSDKPCREGLRSIRLDEFESFHPPRRSRTLLTSQEKEWFASDSGEAVGTVVQDLVDSDWFYVLFKRGRDGRLENEDMGFNISDRMTARRQLLDRMVAEVNDSNSHV